MTTRDEFPVMPTALIADDEPHLARALQTALQAAWPELQIVHMARNGLEAAERLTALRPDVAFLDIQMPGLTGLEVAEGLEGPTRVVFVTAFDEYAVQAFEQQALDYVLKPVKADRLARTVQRLKEALKPAAAPTVEDDRLLQVLRQLGGVAAAGAVGAGATGQEPLRWIRASAGDLMHQIDVQDVRFFEADDKYTVVHTAEGAEHLIRTSITELAQQLDARQFQQIHRSTLINLNSVAGTRRDEASRLFVRLKGVGRELPVSRAYVHLFKAM